MGVIAKGQYGDSEIEAVVINPGDGYDERPWLIGVENLWFVVEAASEQGALDELAESEEHGACIRIDVEVSGQDYTEEFGAGEEINGEVFAERGFMNLKGQVCKEEGAFTRLGGAGEPCDLDHVHTIARWTCLYFDETDKHCNGIKPTEYNERDKRWEVLLGATAAALQSDFRSEKAARAWLTASDHKEEDCEIYDYSPDEDEATAAGLPFAVDQLTVKDEES